MNLSENDVPRASLNGIICRAIKLDEVPAYEHAGLVFVRLVSRSRALTPLYIVNNSWLKVYFKNTCKRMQIKYIFKYYVIIESCLNSSI